jgi:hypothetical protein
MVARAAVRVASAILLCSLPLHLRISIVEAEAPGRFLRRRDRSGRMEARLRRSRKVRSLRDRFYNIAPFHFSFPKGLTAQASLGYG